MRKHWRFSRHFAERFVERFNGTVEDVREITAYFNDHVLECVFHCCLYGSKQRARIGKYTVCYLYDEVDKQVIVTTVF